MKIFALLVLGFVVSAFITKYWFHGFMFYEFPRPPDFLEPIWAADGDIFFNRVITEMFLVLEFLFTSSILYFRWR